MVQISDPCGHDYPTCRYNCRCIRYVNTFWTLYRQNDFLWTTSTWKRTSQSGKRFLQTYRNRCWQTDDVEGILPCPLHDQHYLNNFCNFSFIVPEYLRLSEHVDGLSTDLAINTAMSIVTNTVVTTGHCKWYKNELA